jgi:signal transduction histidine kinase
MALVWGGVCDVAAAQAVGPAGEQKRVLAIYSTRRDSLISDAAERVITARLEGAWGAHLDYYTEYIDPARFPDADFRAFGEFMQHKYPGLQPDVVLAFEGSAIEFVTRYRERLFPAAPVIFFTRDATAARLPNSTGVIEPINFARTLDLLFAVQPDVDQIFVISGASTRDKAYEAAARAQFAPFASKVRFTYLSGLPIADLEARLGSLPPRSVVYPLLISQTASDLFYKPQDLNQRIPSIANRPSYGWHEDLLGRGIVGGSLLQLEPGLRMMAESAEKVLAGEAADRIAVARPQQQIGRVDARQLRRWGLSAARVPVGFAILFEEPTLWRRYGPYLLAIGAVVVGQSLLIGGLLIQARRRRRAEQQLRTSQAELRRSYERIRDIGGRLLTAQEAERSRIARDLHDDITQQMAVLAVDLHSVGGTEQARDHLARIAQSVHDLSHRLHPEALRALGLVGALRSLQQEQARAGLPVTFVHDEIPNSLSAALTLCLFRVVQEALQNAAKYSRASNVTVDLRHAAGGEVTLTITDDGVGFDVEQARGRGLGLISIQERVAAAGGTVTVESSPGAGSRWVVRVRDTVAGAA